MKLKILKNRFRFQGDEPPVLDNQQNCQNVRGKKRRKALQFIKKITGFTLISQWRKKRKVSKLCNEPVFHLSEMITIDANNIEEQRLTQIEKLPLIKPVMVANHDINLTMESDLRDAIIKVTDEQDEKINLESCSLFNGRLHKFSEKIITARNKKIIKIIMIGASIFLLYKLGVLNDSLKYLENYFNRLVDKVTDTIHYFRNFSRNPKILFEITNQLRGGAKPGKRLSSEEIADKISEIRLIKELKTKLVYSRDRQLFEAPWDVMEEIKFGIADFWPYMTRAERYSYVHTIVKLEELKRRLKERDMILKTVNKIHHTNRKALFEKVAKRNLKK